MSNTDKSTDCGSAQDDSGTRQCPECEVSMSLFGPPLSGPWDWVCPTCGDRTPSNRGRPIDRLRERYSDDNPPKEYEQTTLVTDGGREEPSAEVTHRIDAMAELAARWGITVNEADAFLESVGFVEESYKWCPACFRHLEDTDGDPVPAYGKEYCRSCGSALFDNVRDQGVSR